MEKCKITFKLSGYSCVDCKNKTKIGIKPKNCKDDYIVCEDCFNEYYY